MRQDVNGGYHAALARGFDKAEEIGADAVITMDADGQLDTGAIPRALEKLAKVDLVLGVRNTGAARYSEALRIFIHACVSAFPIYFADSRRFASSDIARSAIERRNPVCIPQSRWRCCWSCIHELVPVAVRPRAAGFRALVHRGAEKFVFSAHFAARYSTIFGGDERSSRPCCGGRAGAHDVIAAARQKFCCRLLGSHCCIGCLNRW